MTVSRRDRGRLSRALVLAALLASALTPARAVEKNRVTSILPECAAAGETVAVQGFGFGAENAVVLVGEVPAEIRRATGYRIDFVVPTTAPPGPTTVHVRHRSGNQRGSIAFQVGCGGGFRIVLDPARAASATVEAGGGSILATGADGKTYTLTIPPGALASPQTITLTPVLAISGFRITGPLAGAVHLAPEGLVFALPITLAIDAGGVPPAYLLGFSTSDDGGDFEILALTTSGSTLTLPIEHFTTAGVAAPSLEDFAGIVTEYLNRPQPLDIYDVRSLLDVMEYYKGAFGPTALDLPLWNPAGQVLTGSLASSAMCAPAENLRSQGNLEFARLALHDVIDAIGRMAHLLDVPVDPGCTDETLRNIIVSAGTRASSDPRLLNFTLLVNLSAEAHLLGDEDLEADAIDRLEAALEVLLAQAEQMCQADADAGLQMLQEGSALGFLTLGPLGLFDDFVDALAGCGFDISPTSAAIAFGETVQFTARDRTAPTAAVLWSVEPTAAGSIDATGLFTAGNIAGMYEVIATNSTNPNRYVSAKVEIRPPISVTISPTQATLACPQTLLFTATVNGTSDTAVIWSATGGTILEDGRFRAGATPGAFQVTATSHADSTRSATAAIQVNPAALAVSPASVTLSPGGTRQFEAEINGDPDLEVTWSATGGTISDSGLFTAGATGTFQVRATSSRCATFGEATVVVADHPPMEFVATCYLDQGAVNYRANVRTDTGANGNAVVTVQDAFPAIGTIFDFPLSANSGYNVATTSVYFCQTVQARSYVVTATATSVDYPNDPPMTKTFTFTAADAGGWIPGENCNFTITVTGDCDLACIGDVCTPVP